MLDTIGVDYGIDRLKDVDLGGNNSKGVEDEKSKKRNIQSIPGEHRPSKGNKMDKMDLFLEKWAATLSAKEEASKAKVERYKSAMASGSTSSNFIPDTYSIGIRIDLLENMDGISSCSYNKVIEKFTTVELRQIFVGMSGVRRKDWVDILA
ncbi:hypothetical protein REPUB_Repub06bG0080400 [Reevesia pubescens]